MTIAGSRLQLEDVERRSKSTAAAWPTSADDGFSAFYADESPRAIAKDQA
jgi:hypothetical protein